MTEIPASHRDLLDSQVATLATIDDDGLPQLTEVWFLYDEDRIKVSVNTSRRKLQNLEQRPQCSLLILDLQNPYRYLEVRGRAAIEPDQDRAFAGRVGEKYGTDLSTYDAPEDGRVVITIEPTKVHPVDMG
jgi:hypothetical protein